MLLLLIQWDGLPPSDISRINRTRYQKSPMVGPLSTRSQANSMQIGGMERVAKGYTTTPEPLILSSGKLPDR